MECLWYAVVKYIMAIFINRLSSPLCCSSWKGVSHKYYMIFETKKIVIKLEIMTRWAKWARSDVNGDDVIPYVLWNQYIIKNNLIRDQVIVLLVSHTSEPDKSLRPEYRTKRRCGKGQLLFRMTSVIIVNKISRYEILLWIY